MNLEKQTRVRERLQHALDLQHWYADGGEWWLAEQWELVADELSIELLATPAAPALISAHGVRIPTTR